MVVAQKVKEAEITEQDSLLLTRNLLRIAIFNISYIRGLFPEKYFNDKNVPALEMKIKKLMPMDAESRRLIDWMEKGVYDALQKKYLKTLIFCICEAVDGPMIEEYAFSFSYSNSDSQEVSMNFNRSGSKKGGTFKCNSAEITPNQMRSSACKMVRTLVQLMRTLDKMPEERTILMKLFYYDDVTPSDYEPPFFRGCTEKEGHNSWLKNPLKMEVGNVNSRHLVLALKVKSILDPCEDENDDNEDNVSLGADSLQKDGSSESDSEVSDSDGEEYIVAPAGKPQAQEDETMVEEELTQDPVEDEQQQNRLKEWINSYHLNTVDLTDILASFPDISVVLIEEIMVKLVKEGIVLRAEGDTYTINKQKKSDYEFDAVKEEIDGQDLPKVNNNQNGSSVDYMYMKALYHALPMNYVTVSKLQSKLEGEANQTTVKKLLDKMAQEGFVEPTSNRRLGKRVIHSELTERKLKEVKKTLDLDPMDLDLSESAKKLKLSGLPNNQGDLSTCGALHSIGSDFTRTRGKSDVFQDNSVRSEQTFSKRNGNTPTSKAQPIASSESFAQGKDNGNTNQRDEPEQTCTTQEKNSRKASTVKEPIIQSSKRLKLQGV